jgi:hypothetical protein
MGKRNRPSLGRSRAARGLDQFRKRSICRNQSLIRSPSLRATTRKPWCLIWCSEHSPPADSLAGLGERNAQASAQSSRCCPGPGAERRRNLLVRSTRDDLPRWDATPRALDGGDRPSDRDT